MGSAQFCLLMPNKSAQEASQIAETLRGKIQTHAFIYEGKRIPVTSSIGVAELKSNMDDPSELIKSADKALYESKQGGRNRVTIAN